MQKAFFLLSVFLITLFSLFTFEVGAQELPPITTFSPATYKADNQNWQASQNKEGVVFFANNKGLLSFNGAQWQLYASPNETIIRSVKALDNRVYTGAHMDFGYWETNVDGSLCYTSLKNAFGLRMVEGEQIWKIISYDGNVLFQSLNGIYIYNTENHRISYMLVDTNNGMYRLFNIGDELYFQVLGKGLFKIENGKPILYDTRDIFKTTVFVNIFDREGVWLGITQKDGFFRINDIGISPWTHQAASLLDTTTVYRAIALLDQGFAIGTIANGFIKLDTKGSLEYQITQSTGLGNNTVLSLFEDGAHNIWIGLDNGIAVINTEIAIKNYVDPKGRLGTIYDAVIHNGILYLGTNQGLFYRVEGSNDFKLVAGTEEQVWSLRIINDQLFCGHNKGTFLVDQGRQQLIGAVSGTWDIRTIPNKPDLLLQGNYDGLYVLKREDNVWSVRNKLSDFNISSRHFEFVEDYKILVGNEYKGVYEVVVDSTFAKAVEIALNSSVAKGEHSSLEYFNDNVYYANKEGIFTYNKKTAQFKKENVISDLSKGDYLSGKLVNDGAGKLWSFTKNEIIHLTENPLDTNLSVSRIHLPQSLRNTAKGFENIAKIASDEYILGTTNGYLKINNNLPEKSYEIKINQVINIKRDTTSKLIDLQTNGSFHWKENNISFTYYVPHYDKYRQTQYQHKLKGLYDTWSSFEANASQEYTNIPAGDYTFEVRARVGNTFTSNIASYTFTINKAWYQTYYAFAGYVVLSILLLLVLANINRRKYKIRQNKLLEKAKDEMERNALAIEKENVQLRNERLRNDIAARNRELAASAMNTVKKSKILKDIKEKLSQLESTKELNAIIKDINKNIDSKEDWRSFEQAFNHADKDFFKQLKKRHPSLTSSDLRLCVYLRLNMTSKEIAPLLNISPRSVEIKRYRLRKKLKLDQSVQLNDYFINL